jgi:hypothetical protein
MVWLIIPMGWSFGSSCKMRDGALQWIFAMAICHSHFAILAICLLILHLSVNCDTIVDSVC